MSGWSILVCDVTGEIISLLLLWNVGVLEEEEDCFVVTTAALCLFADDVVKGGMAGTLLLPPLAAALVAIVAVGRMTNGLEFTLVAAVGVDCCC